MTQGEKIFLIAEIPFLRQRGAVCTANHLYAEAEPVR